MITNGSAIRITETFRWKLPHRFLGYPTNFNAPNPDDNGVQLLAATDAGPVNHRVEIYTIRGFFQGYLEFDIAGEIEPADWLTFGEQALRTIAAGAVFHDDLGLAAVRARFAYYPPRCVALHAGSRVGAHRPGGAPDGPRRPGR